MFVLSVFSGTTVCPDQACGTWTTPRDTSRFTETQERSKYTTTAVKAASAFVNSHDLLYTLRMPPCIDQSPARGYAAKETEWLTRHIRPHGCLDKIVTASKCKVVQLLNTFAKLVLVIGPGVLMRAPEIGRTAPSGRRDGHRAF